MLVALSLALSVLAVDPPPPLEPPPPPTLVEPAQVPPPPLPPLPSADAPVAAPPTPPLVPAPEAPGVTLAETSGRRAARIFATIGMGVLVGGVIATAATLITTATCNASTASAALGCAFGIVALVLVEAVLLLVMPAGVAVPSMAVHRLMGGRGNVGWAFLGTFLGGFVGAGAAALVQYARRTHTLTTDMLVWTSFLAVFGAVGAGLMLELGHLLSVPAPPITPVLAPLPGGAAIGAMVRF